MTDNLIRNCIKEIGHQIKSHRSISCHGNSKTKHEIYFMKSTIVSLFVSVCRIFLFILIYYHSRQNTLIHTSAWYASSYKPPRLIYFIQFCLLSLDFIIQESWRVAVHLILLWILNVGFDLFIFLIKKSINYHYLASVEICLPPLTHFSPSFRPCSVCTII